MSSSFGLGSPVWWEISWCFAHAILLGRRCFLFYAEDAKPASEKFQLRSNSLSYVSLWGLFAAATIFFAIYSEDIEGAGPFLALFAAEFVAICLWRPYFGNGTLIKVLVAETHHRLHYLTKQGLGMDDRESRHFRSQSERAVVELWTRRLRDQDWQQMSGKDKDALLFDTGMVCGEALETALWEGVMSDFAAFFQEWRMEVEDFRGCVRVSDEVKQSIIAGTDLERQERLSVGIFIANEDAELRAARKDTWNERLAARQFPAARIARRKAAADGILKWPDALSQEPRVHITRTEMHLENLELIDAQRRRYPCNDVTQLPFTVLYTLAEIIRSGYLRIQPNGTIQAKIAFRYGAMVFRLDDWNVLRSIERRPFRYMTAATRTAGEIAFVVEQREIASAAELPDGSVSLRGEMRLAMQANVIQDATSWIARATQPTTEVHSLWGRIEDLSPARSVHFLNLPVLWLIDAATWALRRCREVPVGRAVLEGRSEELPVVQCSQAAELLDNRHKGRGGGDSRRLAAKAAYQAELGSVLVTSRKDLHKRATSSEDRFSDRVSERFSSA